MKKTSINEKILTISFVPGGQLDGREQALHFSLSNTNRKQLTDCTELQVGCFIEKE